ncbi:homoserine O-acetyltransferase MetX [Natranaerofaba carboxydovora]|uniref:homoserine O-acetyltransferase MetX n=1 Tax=Natranaerofaba carboxydovora TaxID=2742683 RepID=UPI001F13B585|nr:homoserine O-acetyltransferase [Natranaerofaba carboxydovora]UMZ72616.1 Homoserine O-acetyltransferase [Natranaerofaba carboxydovora]
MNTSYYELKTPFELENGDILENVQIAYDTYGKLNDSGDNAILVCHALTGSSQAGVEGGSDNLEDGFWAPIIGPGRLFDTNRYFVVCMNILGSCYGTTGPMSKDPNTGEPYGPDFPKINIKDIVKLQHEMMDVLGIKRWYAVAGGSIGGMQALEWAIMYPEKLEKTIVIAAPFWLNSHAIGYNWIGIRAIKQDRNFHQGYYYKYGVRPDEGLALARMAAMLTYKSGELLTERFDRQGKDVRYGEAEYEVESYLEHQGEKFINRFDANSYLTLVDAMNSHDVRLPYNGDLKKALSRIKAKVLLVGIEEDLLYPPSLKEYMKDELRKASVDVEHEEFSSPHGHDAFLVEFNKLAKVIKPFLEKKSISDVKSGIF